jgi:hypothetical protein
MYLSFLETSSSPRSSLGSSCPGLDSATLVRLLELEMALGSVMDTLPLLVLWTLGSVSDVAPKGASYRWEYLDEAIFTCKPFDYWTNPNLRCVGKFNINLNCVFMLRVNYKK